MPRFLKGRRVACAAADPNIAGGMFVYGGLSLEASQIDPASLIFEGKRVEGFWLTAWLRRRNMLSGYALHATSSKCLPVICRPRFRLGFRSKRSLAAWKRFCLSEVRLYHRA